jgi:hypothetical protein
VGRRCVRKKEVSANGWPGCCLLNGGPLLPSVIYTRIPKTHNTNSNRQPHSPPSHQPLNDKLLRKRLNRLEEDAQGGAEGGGAGAGKTGADDTDCGVGSWVGWLGAQS